MIAIRLRGSVPWFSLLAVPARAHTELEAPARDAVDAGHLLGGGDRVALDHEADAAPDPDVARRLRRTRERDEQVVGVAVFAGQLAARRVRRRAGSRDVRVLGEEQRLVPALLGEPRERARLDAIVSREAGESELHGGQAYPARRVDSRPHGSDTVVHRPGSIGGPGFSKGG